MKTIFRSTSIALLFAAVIALGAVAGFAQDPCTDAEGQAALDKQFRELYPKKDLEGRKSAIDTGKQFQEKYGACKSAELLSEYLKSALPKLETAYQKEVVRLRRSDLEKKFTLALGTKTWDDVYSTGKQLLAEDADEYRAIVLVLGSIGLEETAKTPPVTKWNDDTLRYAKQAIQDLEANKVFKQYGVKSKDTNFVYTNKEDALGWMNYSVGYINLYDKKNSKEAVSYLYKASQAASDTKTTPVVFSSIGTYYYGEAKKLIAEIAAMPKAVPADTPEVAEAKLSAFKAKEGILYGTFERALDAYSRAWKLAPNTPAYKVYKDEMLKTLTELYSLRFDKTEGMNAWIDATVTKPMPNPATAVTPVNSPEPVTTTTSTSTTPAVTAPAKPVVPAIKPQSVVTNVSAKTGASTTAVTAKPVVKAVVKKKGTR